MSCVFLDTAGMLALWDDTDQWHSAATEAHQRLMTHRGSLWFVSTTFVLLECGNAATRRPLRSVVMRLRERLEEADNLIFPTEADWQQAWVVYAGREGNSAGIVDCVSFVVMRRLGIQQAFTNDEHFRAAGFETLF